MNADTLLNILPLSRNVSTAMRNIFTSSVIFWSDVGSKSLETLQCNIKNRFCVQTHKALRMIVKSSLVVTGVSFRRFHFNISC